MRQTRCLYHKHLLAVLSLAALFWIGSPASAQSTQDHDTTTRELASFDIFMDAHPEIAEQVRKDPSLVRNQEFVKNHPALQEYLQVHPAVTEEISENPRAFMHQEQRFERREDGRELASLDRFLDSHPEIAEQLRKDPALVNNKEFVAKHPALEQFLRANDGVAQQWRQNPNAFMQEEQRFDRQEDVRDHDTTRWQLANMDRFLDSHPEIAEQLRKDPSLVNNKEFVAKHPELQSYLQQHPGIREEFSENPNAFMRQEQHFDRQEDFGRNKGGFDRDPEHREATNFGQFLGGHANIAQQVSKDPSLLNNKEYMESHPELQEYMKAHPAAQAELKQNPQAFLQSMPQASKPMPKAPTVERPAQKQQ